MLLTGNLELLFAFDNGDISFGLEFNFGLLLLFDFAVIGVTGLAGLESLNVALVAAKEVVLSCFIRYPTNCEHRSWKTLAYFKVLLQMMDGDLDSVESMSS